MLSNLANSHHCSTSSDKTASKKKRKSFGLLGSNPSVAPLDLKMSTATGAAILKKSSGGLPT